MALYIVLRTHHSPLTTHHSPLTTHHSPLTTHHSPLTTHHSPLTTHGCIAFSLEGKRLATAGLDAAAKPCVCLWDASTGQQLRTLPVETRRVAFLAFSGDGQSLITR